MALIKGRTLPLLQVALDLRHNRKTTRNVGHVRAAWGSSCPPRWLLVLQKQVFSLYNIVRVLTYPRVERGTGASYRGTMTQSIRRKLPLGMHYQCSSYLGPGHCSSFIPLGFI